MINLNTFNDNSFEIKRYQPLSDVICQSLREAIVKGELKPGERLMEIQFANKLGVSRTPFREAIRRLELEGLVTVLPRRGAHVSELSKKDIREVLEIRCALDALAASLCAVRMEENQIQELEQVATRFERYMQDSNIDALVETDIQLHEIIYKGANNSRLETLYMGLSDQIHRYRILYLRDKSNYADLASEHNKLITAIKNRDDILASEISRLHITHQEQSILENIEKREG